jgi:hypothetical protein
MLLKGIANLFCPAISSVGARHLTSRNILCCILALAACSANGSSAGSGSDECLDCVSIVSVDPNIDGMEDSFSVKVLRRNIRYETFPRWGEEVDSVGSAIIMAAPTGLYVFVRTIQTRSISATASKHDSFSESDDSIRLAVVPNPLINRAYFFEVNAAGATSDRIYSSSGAPNDEWSGLWSAAVHLSATSFDAEYMIPWATIDLVPAGAEVRVNIERHYSKGRKEVVASSRIDSRNDCRECQFDKLYIPAAVEAPAAKASARWLPYAAASSQENWSPQTERRVSSVRDERVGLDVFFSELDGTKTFATLNPDFSQVESDVFVSKINRRFATAFPERRNFFSEELGAYTTPMTLLYTRSIGDPTVGFQRVYRHDGTTRAYLLADDSETTFQRVGQSSSQVVTINAPSQNFAFRGTSSLGVENARMGTFATVRHARGYANAVLAADINWHANALHSVVGQVALSMTSLDSESEFGPQSVSNGFAGLFRHQYTIGNYTAATTISSYDSDFRADLGRVQRVGTTTVSHASTLTWPAEDGSWLSYTSISAQAQYVGDNDGELLDRSVGLEGEIAFSNEITISASLSDFGSRSGETLIASQSLGIQANAPVGAIGFLSVGFGKGTSPDYINNTFGRDSSFSVGLSLRGVEWLDGIVGWNRQTFDSDASEAGYSVEGLFLRGNIHFSLRQHLSLFYNTIIDRDFLTPETIDVEPVQLARWQGVYTYQVTRFGRVIFGASESAVGGPGIDGRNVQGRTIFAKWVYEI